MKPYLRSATISVAVNKLTKYYDKNPTSSLLKAKYKIKPPVLIYLKARFIIYGARSLKPVIKLVYTIGKPIWAISSLLKRIENYLTGLWFSLSKYDSKYDRKF